MYLIAKRFFLAKISIDIVVSNRVWEIEVLSNRGTFDALSYSPSDDPKLEPSTHQTCNTNKPNNLRNNWKSARHPNLTQYLTPESLHWWIPSQLELCFNRIEKRINYQSSSTRNQTSCSDPPGKANNFVGYRQKSSVLWALNRQSSALYSYSFRFGAGSRQELAKYKTFLFTKVKR